MYTSVVYVMPPSHTCSQSLSNLAYILPTLFHVDERRDRASLLHHALCIPRWRRTHYMNPMFQLLGSVGENERPTQYRAS